jgi:hypothetical protein
LLPEQRNDAKILREYPAGIDLMMWKLKTAVSAKKITCIMGYTILYPVHKYNTFKIE